MEERYYRVSLKIENDTNFLALNDSQLRLLSYLQKEYYLTEDLVIDVEESKYKTL